MMWRWDDDDWFVKPVEFKQPVLHYRNWRKWHWSRIYNTFFWIALPIAVIFLRWP